MVARFKVGQKVILARNLGRKLGYSSDDYYYEGTIREVSLRTKGVVNRIGNPEKLHISFDNGGGWWCHPDELDYLGLSEEIPGLKKLEPHPLLEMSKDNPLFVVDGQVFSAGERIDKKKKQDKNFFYDFRLFGDVVKEVTPVMDLDSLDDVALQRNQPLIEKLAKEYSQEVWDGFSDLRRRLNPVGDIPHAIFSSVFPYLRGDGYDRKIAEEIGGEKAKEEQERKQKSRKINHEKIEETADRICSGIISEVAELVGSEALLDRETRTRSRLESKLDALLSEETAKPYENTTLIGRAFGTTAFALINGEFFPLHKREGRIRDYISINGREFVLGERGLLENVNDRYQQLLSIKIKNSVLKNDFSRPAIIEKLKSEAAEEVLGESYEEGDFGFTKHGDYYYAYLNVPAFGIKCPYMGQDHFDCELKNYYKFSGGKVAIRVSNPECSFYDNIYLLNRNGLSDLCIGNAILPAGGKDYGEVIAKRLKQVRAMIFSGITKDWYIGSPIYFQTTYKELRAKKLPIINPKKEVLKDGK